LAGRNGVADEFGGEGIGNAIALLFSIFIQFSIPNAALHFTLHIFREDAQTTRHLCASLVSRPKKRAYGV
jgi:hypothetical protein